MADLLKKKWLHILLFACLGIFSLLLITRFTNVDLSGVQGIWRFILLISFMLGFSFLGYATLWGAEWLHSNYPQYADRRFKMRLFYVAVALVLFLLNYAVFVAIKLTVGARHPFLFPNGGWGILLLVWLMEWVVIGLLMANRSMQKTLELQQRTAKLQSEYDMARYSALQHQIDPHFLFNSLNTLVAEIEYDPKNAVVFVHNLSDVYRYVLRMRERKLVTIAEEMDFLQAYVFLQKVRLGECVDIINRIPADLQEASIPPLTLQLLVENSFKHNVVSEQKKLTLNFNCQEGYLCVENNLNIRKRDDAACVGVGLKNLDSQCRLVTGKPLQIIKNDQTFCVKVPLINE